MAVLTLSLTLGLAALGLAACYSPELTDCTASCGNTDECAGDQTCSAGFCAAEGVDCRAEPMSPERVSLRVDVMGEGIVVVAGVGTCMTEGGGPGPGPGPGANSCNWTVDRGAVLQLEARMLIDKPFDKWTTPTCEGQDATCSITASDSLVIGAKFH